MSVSRLSSASRYSDNSGIPSEYRSCYLAIVNRVEYWNRYYILAIHLIADLTYLYWCERAVAVQIGSSFSITLQKVRQISIKPVTVHIEPLMHTDMTVPLAVLMLLATSAATAHAATNCPAGWGIKNFNILGVLGGIITGNPNTAEPACAPCGSWEASKGGPDARCELCLPGISTPNAFNTACECVPGTYEAPDANGAYATSVIRNCVRCPADSVSNSNNAKYCTKCPSGTAPGKNNKCNCPTGYRATAVTENGAAGCVKCEEGFVSPGGLSTTCNSCPDFSVPLPSGDYCGCLPGSKLNSSVPFSCAACASVFEYTQEPNRLFMCQQCFPFSYANKEHTGCDCTGGYYAIKPDVQPVRCRPCPSGTFKAGPGNDVSLCISCPQGLEPSGSGRQCVTPPCPAGTERSADGSCTACPETHFNLLRNGTCQPCNDHTLSSPDRTRCDICKEGYLQTSDSGEDLACNDCMHGWKWNPATSSCDEDQSVPTGDQPHDTSLPADDAWMQYVPGIVASYGGNAYQSDVNGTRAGGRLASARFTGVAGLQ